MEIEIEVTAEDIERGVPNSPCACPIALAMDRAGYEPIVSADTAICGTKAFLLPAAARRFIQAFDGKQLVQPFSFVLRKPRRRRR